MSDSHGDFDDDGIYREKSLSRDTGMLVDEHGIWREDSDSLYTFHTDSGLGTRKSSDGGHFGQFRDTNRDFNALYEDYKDRESYTTDAKSVNISEFEASESAAEESFEDRSLGSDDNIEFPELNDESYDDFLGDGDLFGGLSRQRKKEVTESDLIKDVVQSVAMEMPEVTGDSIFTQQEDIELVAGLGHSLAEFEHLEAQIELDTGDNADLIGAYLKDLKEKAEDDETELGAESNGFIPSIAFESNEHDSINLAETPSKIKSPSPSPSEKLKHRARLPNRALKTFPQPTTTQSPRQPTAENNRCLPVTPVSRSRSQLQLRQTEDTSPPPRPSSAGTPRTNGMGFTPDNGRPHIPQSTDLTHANLCELRMSIEESDLSNAEKAHELKALFLQEVHQRRLNDETYHQLQIEYNSLLKKYAEAENTIDELRLGAKVTLFSDSPVPPTAPSVSTQQQNKSTNAALMGRSSVSAGTPSTAQVSASRPASCASITSVFALNADQATDQTESASTVEDTAKLAIMAKSKAVEDQINAFQILLTEKHLSLGDQEQALSNIKKTFEDLRHHHREAKDEHEFLRRQRLTPGGASESSVIGGFDENKDLEGAIYKLSMKLDDVDHRVQENLKERTKRKPYQGGPQPVRGDHSIAVPSSERPASVDSISPEVDRKMQRLLKEFDHLMRRYQGLKQMKRSPQRDEEISRLVQDLKGIYDQAPDHSKPSVPEELAPKINGRRGSHTSPSYNTRSSHDRRSRSSDESRRSSPQVSHPANEDDHRDEDYYSDASYNDRGSKASMCSREERSSDYTSGMSRPASDLRPRGRRELPDTSDKKVAQKPLPQGSGGHRRLPKVTGQRSKVTGQRSNVIGQRLNDRNGSSAKHPQRSSRIGRNDRGFVRTDARSPLDGDYSFSDSDSSVDSVVEHSRRNGFNARHDFSGGSHSSVDSFDDHGRNGRAVYGSQSESDSDEALSLEENSRSRDRLNPKRVPISAHHRATRGASTHQSHNAPHTRWGRPLSPPQYDQVYRRAKQQASRSPHARGGRRHLDFADDNDAIRSPEVQFILQPSSSKMRRYPSMPNLANSRLSEAPVYLAARSYDEVDQPAYEYGNPDMIYDANVPHEAPPLVPVDQIATSGVHPEQCAPARRYSSAEPLFESTHSKYNSGRRRSGQSAYAPGAAQCASELNQSGAYSHHQTQIGSGPAAQYATGQSPYVSEQHNHYDADPAHYGSGAAHYGSGPAQYGSGAAHYGSGPAHYGSGAAQYGSGLAHYGSGAAHYGSGPAHLVPGPAQYSSPSQCLPEPTQYASTQVQYVTRHAADGVLTSGASSRRVVHRGLKPSRVRYYVREYGPQNSDSEDSDDPDLGGCIRSALKTAKHLQSVSQRMKNKLKSQMIRSYSESNLLF